MFKMCRKQEAPAIRLKIEGKGPVNVHYVTKMRGWQEGIWMF